MQSLSSQILRVLLPIVVVSANPANAQTSVFTVSGKAGLSGCNSQAGPFATGITYSQGDLVGITASGLVNWTSPGGTWDGPDGQPNAFYQSMCVPEAERSSLVASIGGVNFKVGSSFTGLAPASGELILGVNDDFYGDNQGSFTVNVHTCVTCNGPGQLCEDFPLVAGPFAGGSCSTSGTTPTGHAGWEVANLRHQDCPSVSGEVEFTGSSARLWDDANSANGGYNGLFHSVSSTSTDWILTVDVLVNHVQDPVFRPVPGCFVGFYNPVLFPGEQTKGWAATSGQVLGLKDGSDTTAISSPAYVLAEDIWHTVELTSTVSGSEIRAWPRDGGQRPDSALAVGQSLGQASRVLFNGPNWKNYDYEVTNITLGPASPGGSVTSYCTATPNSTGIPASMSYSGSLSVSANCLTLNARNAPAGQFGLIYYGPNAVQLPFGNGYRCVGGGFNRLPVLLVDQAGDASHYLDLANPPTGGGQILGGSTWYFQFWFRDGAAGGAGFNLSDALCMTFVP